MNTFKTVVCFQTYDGRLFMDERQANEHSENLLGEELDGLFKLAFKDIDLGRSRQMKALLSLMKDRKELKQSIDTLHGILDFQFRGDEE